MSICVLDYGMGNLRSVEKAFVFLGHPCKVIDRGENASKMSGLVLPGVGSFGRAMQELERRGFIELILDTVSRGIPLLGICLGFQLLFEESEESPGIRGLCLMAGKVKRIEDSVKVPHMGWNDVRWTRSHPVLEGVKSGSFFYFVHSYHPLPVRQEAILGMTYYGGEFVSAIAHDNVVGFQFHPEKSSSAGLKLLDNFARWCEIFV